MWSQLRPDHAHPLGLQFILGRTLLTVCAWGLHARYTCICRLYIEHVTRLFRRSTRDTRAYVMYSWAWKLGEATYLSERIEIFYITTVFISVLVCFVIAAILAHIAWVLAREWMLSIRTAKNSYMGVYPGVGGCLGHYGMSSWLQNHFMPTKMNELCVSMSCVE